VSVGKRLDLNAIVAKMEGQLEANVLRVASAICQGA